MMLMALLVLLAPDAVTERRIAVADTVVVKVGDRQKAGDTIVAAAEAAGGYFTSRTDDALRLRVPTAKANDVLSVARAQGVVVSNAHDTTDLTETIEEQRGLLASRREVLERYFAVLRTARASAVTTVEREMTDLIAQIEELEGALRLEEHNLGYATIDVSFQFRDRGAPVNDGRSSFRWLNTMNLADLLGDFQHGVQ